MQSSLGIIPARPIFPSRHRSRRQNKMFLARLTRAGRMSPPGIVLAMGETTMKKLQVRIRSNHWARATYLFLACLCLLLAVTLSAQAPESSAKAGIVRQLSDVKFPPGDGPDCLQFFLQNGDMKTGPSTAIMKAAPKCVVPPHYHTAEEQLIIVKGYVSTGMQGMKDTVLAPGGFAMMPSKAPHWFTCTAKEECLMFVTFDRAYDIVWLKPSK
jgi:quercetin dioxygenase-like cupin family protein